MNEPSESSFANLGLASLCSRWAKCLIKRIGHRESVELVQLALQKLFVGQSRLVLGDECRRNRATERVFDDFIVLRCTEQHADRWSFVRLADIAVERFEFKLQLAEILWLKVVDLEFDRDEASQLAVIKHELDPKILAADLDQVFLADKAKVAAQFENELLQSRDQRGL